MLRNRPPAAPLGMLGGVRTKVARRKKRTGKKRGGRKANGRFKKKGR